MSYNIFSKYDIYTFSNKKNKYSKIIKSIQDSKSYIYYTDSSNGNPIFNKRYQRYLEEKQIMYVSNMPKDNNSKLFITLSNTDYSEKRIDELYNTYSIQNDYYHDKTLKYLNEEETAYQIVHQVHLFEEEMLNNGVVIYDSINRVDSSYINKSFANARTSRFILLPFIAKHNEYNVLPTIIVTVYDTGIITAQTIIAFEEASLKLLDHSPNTLLFSDIQFYNLKKEYLTRDFWLKNKIDEGTLYDIHDYYFKFLDTITGEKLNTDKDQSHYNWVISDFNFFKSKRNYLEFFNENKRVLYGYLKNSNEILISRYAEESLDDMLEKMKIDANQAYGFYCGKQGSILLFGTNIMYEHIKDFLANEKKGLEKEKLYESEFKHLAKRVIIETMFEYLRFYELALVKKFFARSILQDLANSVYMKLDDFKKIRQNLNNLELRYNARLIFKSEGSPIEIYNDLLEKTDTNATIESVSKLLKSTTDDFSEKRDKKIKAQDLYTTMLTSLLAVLFGFGGLKSFVDNALIHFSFFGIGSFVSTHLYTSTFILWGILFLVLLIFNFMKFSSYRK